MSPTAARYRDEGGEDESSNDEDSLTMDEDVRRERMRVLNGGSAGDVLQVTNNLFTSFFIVVSVLLPENLRFHLQLNL